MTKTSLTEGCVCGAKVRVGWHDPECHEDGIDTFAVRSRTP